MAIKLFIRTYTRGSGVYLTALLIAGYGCQEDTGNSVLVSSVGVPSADNAIEFSLNEGQGHDRRRGRASYVPDCNDPEALNHNCIHPNDAFIASLRAQGYPYYIGHAEPTMAFFSTEPNSGTNMQWKLILPATDPAPTQNGSSVSDFELFAADWLSLVLCDPNSYPYGNCTAASDSNNQSTAGAGLLELQFYPPRSNSSATQWVINYTTWTAHENSPFVVSTCSETGFGQYVTTNGRTTGSKLLLSSGDSIVVTIHDTASGLEADVFDQTSGATGSMVASGANGFRHNTTLVTHGFCSITTTQQCSVKSDCPTGESCDCQTEPFDFHAMYATASPGQVLSWGRADINVAFASEIGHWELCGDAACTIKPDGSDESSTPTCATLGGVGGCTDSDTDHDGISYQADWPDGSSSHPSSIIIGAVNNTGVGPLSPSAINANDYIFGYGTSAFSTTEGTSGAFYPFYSAAGYGQLCRFNFGNDIPGKTVNDFSRAGQYTGTLMNNPCFPGLAAGLILSAESILMPG